MPTPATRRPITQADRQDVIDFITGGMTDLLFGSPGLFNDRPGFIAGGGSTAALPNLVRAISRANCRNWAAANKSGFSTRVNVGNSELCTPYLNGLGELPGNGSISPGFTGGQCVGVAYTVRRQNQTIAGPFGNPANTSGLGPVLGPYLQIDGLSASAGIEFASGKVQTISGPAAEIRAPTIISVTRQDGGADNCGDRPSEIQPPDTITPPAAPQPPQITIQLPGFGDLKITVGLDADGNPVVCIPEFSDCFTIIPPGSPGDVAPTTPGSPGTPATTGSGGESSGTAPTGSELSGVGVEILTFPPAAARFQNNARQPFRGAGYIAMGYPGLLGIDMSGGVINLSQFFHAQQRGLSSWRVSANIGFNLRCTPYYREVSPE